MAFGTHKINLRVTQNGFTGVLFIETIHTPEPMSQEQDIQPLLHKFIQNECSPQEIEFLIAHFQKEKATEDLPTFEELLDLLEEIPEMQPERAKSMYLDILQEGKAQRKTAPSRKIWHYASVAAVFIGILTIGYFYQQGAFDASPENLLVPANESITLQLEDGTIQVIDPTSSKAVKDAKGNLVANQAQSQLDYTATGETEALVYNTLKVPYGKRFDVVLSDGTMVYLNSGTELKYPVSFLSAGNREVFVEGEAYFDVTSDTDRPFIVNAEALNVEVLGTEFNVLAYPEDGVADVVLVEGSVGMYATNSGVENTTVLTPGLKGSFDKVDAAIRTEQVNTNVYTAWRSGELVYRNLPFKNIVKKLERHYNIKIELNNAALGEEPLNASFKDKTIEEVLSYFDELYGIDHTVSNNTIYIN